MMVVVGFGGWVGEQKTRRVFREPQAMIVKEGARIMSLLDGTSKVQLLIYTDNDSNIDDC
jgi:alkylation response protein AidB-like acyl-CoA dehydrogenase